MADIVTTEQLRNASLDAQTLEKFVNGNETQVNKPRLLPNVDIGSIAELRKKVQDKVDRQIATLPLGHKGYATIALAQAAQASLPANTLVEVTNDPVDANNGVYLWDGNALTRSSYDAKQYSDKSQYVAINATQNSVENIASTVFQRSTLQVEKAVGRGQGAYAALEITTNTTAKTVELTLKKGDMLEFNYQKYRGTILQEMASPITYPILVNAVESADTANYRYIANKDMTVRITGYVSGTVKVNGANVTGTDIGTWLSHQKVGTANNGIFADMQTTAWFNVAKGDIVNLTLCKSDTVPIVYDSGDAVARTLLAIQKENDGVIRFYNIEWVAPYDLKIAASNHKDGVISVIKAPSVNNASFIPGVVTLPQQEKVFATAMNFILKLETVNGKEQIATSTDLGKTWLYTPNILGDIVNYHFFADGTILLCSPTKCYWTTDYTTLNEAQIYDVDGSVFAPQRRHFFAMQTGDKIDFIGDTEIFSWGEYTINESYQPRIWYTVDNGRTIKCSVKFGETSLGGVVRSIRHVHRVYYHAKTNYWYVTTGDEGSECMLIRGRYDVATDKWSWKILGSGIEYKFGNIMIDDNNIAYLITDYTDPSLRDKKGVYRVHAKYLDDITKYRYVYRCDRAEWGDIAPVSLLMDNNGNKVLLPDYLGTGWIWVARDGVNFKKVKVSPNVLLAYTIGENYNGDIWCVQYEGGQNQNLRLSSGSFNLTKALRDAGVKDWMRGTPKLVSGLTTVLS